MNPRRTAVPLDTEPITTCPACGSCTARVAHANVADHCFSVPGTWQINTCCTCGSLYLATRVPFENVMEIYKNYPEHHRAKQAGKGGKRNPIVALFPASVRRALKLGILNSRLGYLSSGAATLPFLVGKALGSLSRVKFDRIEASVMFLPYRPGGAVLDVGCGAGGLLADLRNHGWTVRGIDFDPEAVAIARNFDIHVTCGTLSEHNFPPEAFDAITMKHVIEHEYQPDELLKECYRALKPGGRLSIITPNAASYGHMKFGPFWRGLEPPRHTQIYSMAGISHALSKAGFDKVAAWTNARNARFMWGASRNACKKNTRGVIAGIRGLLFALRERTMRDASEELCAIAQKPTA